MIDPCRTDDDFLADVAAARAAEGLHLWWLGQSGYLIIESGRHVLIDPYLSDSLTRKYAGTERPHVRMMRRIVDPARLDFIDLVTSSHSHTDHLDPDTLQPLIAANEGLRCIAPEASRALAAERAGIAPHRLIGLDDGATVAVSGVRITAVASAHESVERDAEGRCKFLGYVFQLGPFQVYHSGDTVLHDGLVSALEPLGVDVALLPINGAKPERGVPGNLTGAEAAGLAKGIRAGVVIPCHYDMFEFNTASPDEFRAECRRIDQPFRVLEAGERWSLRPR